MFRLLLVPVLLIGAFLLFGHQLGSLRVPDQIVGLPMPMVLFIGLAAGVISMLRAI